MKNATTKNLSTTDDESSMNRFPYQLDLINIATYLAENVNAKPLHQLITNYAES